MKVTSASFLMGEARRILALYHDPSENLADTKSPLFEMKPNAAVANLWCIENSCTRFSSEVMPATLGN
jgi:hypothetical protein